MITSKMKLYLEGKLKLKTRDKQVERAVYLKRIQQRVDRELDQLFWLCQKHPEIFLCKPSLNDYGHEVNYIKSFGSAEGKKRFKLLLHCIMVLTRLDVELQLLEVREEDD